MKAIKDRGRRIRFAMQARGVRKQFSLAVELGVDQSTLCRWTKGGTLTIENAINLCEVLDVSLDWLLLGRGDIEQHKCRSVSASEWELVYSLRNLHPKVVDSLVIHVRTLNVVARSTEKRSGYGCALMSA